MTKYANDRYESEVDFCNIECLNGLNYGNEKDYDFNNRNNIDFFLPLLVMYEKQFAFFGFVTQTGKYLSIEDLEREANSGSRLTLFQNKIVEILSLYTFVRIVGSDYYIIKPQTCRLTNQKFSRTLCFSRNENLDLFLSTKINKLTKFEDCIQYYTTLPELEILKHSTRQYLLYEKTQESENIKFIPIDNDLVYINVNEFEVKNIRQKILSKLGYFPSNLPEKYFVINKFTRFYYFYTPKEIISSIFGEGKPINVNPTNIYNINSDITLAQITKPANNDYNNNNNNNNNNNTSKNDDNTTSTTENNITTERQTTLPSSIFSNYSAFYYTPTQTYETSNPAIMHYYGIAEKFVIFKRGFLDNVPNNNARNSKSKYNVPVFVKQQVAGRNKLVYILIGFFEKNNGFLSDFKQLTEIKGLRKNFTDFLNPEKHRINQKLNTLKPPISADLGIKKDDPVVQSCRYEKQFIYFEVVPELEKTYEYELKINTISELQNYRISISNIDIAPSRKRKAESDGKNIQDLVEKEKSDNLVAESDSNGADLNLQPQ